MKLTVFLLAFAGVLGFFGCVQAECCDRALAMKYAVDGGTCADAGGFSVSNGCSITVCADGKPRVGSYCGRGPCNIFGCACKDGCLSGDWKASFLNENRGHRIVVIDQRWI